METIICPFCNELTEIETDEHYEGYEEYECGNCNKIFEVFAEATIDYSACEKADCLNGGKHKWVQILGYPEINFKGKYRCEDCSAEYTNESEVATKREWKKYFKELGN